MKHIYAFLVGINQYPETYLELNGCENDVNKLSKTLKKIADFSSIDYQELCLLNQEATYDNIIKTGFLNFLLEGSQKKNCTLIFYYSGHGAQQNIKINDQIEKSEGLFCFDAKEKGHLIADIEISHLISYIISHGQKDNNFTVILDACHSGSGTRSTQLEYIKSRLSYQLPTRTNETLLSETTTGIPIPKITPYSQDVINKRISPPHYLLAACSPTQLANETIIDGMTNGIFTHLLCTELEKTPFASYKDLINTLNRKVKNLIAQQSPQLDTYQVNENTTFLSLPFSVEKAHKHTVFYDKSWKIDAGDSTTSTIDNQSEIVIYDEEKKIGNCSIRTIQVNTSTLENIHHYYLDKEKTYQAEVIESYFLSYYIDKGKEIDLLKNNHIYLTEKKNAEIFIKENNNKLTFFNQVTHQLICDSPIDGSNSQEIIIKTLLHIKTWFQEINKKSVTKSWETPPLEYSLISNKAIQKGTSYSLKCDFTPSFDQVEKNKITLSITNTSNVDVWFSLRYFGSDLEMMMIPFGKDNKTDKKIYCKQLSPKENYQLNLQSTIPINKIAKGNTLLQDNIQVYTSSEVFTPNNDIQLPKITNITKNHRAIGKFSFQKSPFKALVENIKIKSYSHSLPFYFDEKEKLFYSNLGIKIKIQKAHIFLSNAFYHQQEKRKPIFITPEILSKNLFFFNDGHHKDDGLSIININSELQQEIEINLSNTLISDQYDLIIINEKDDVQKHLSLSSPKFSFPLEKGQYYLFFFQK